MKAKPRIVHINDRDQGGGAARIAHDLHLFCLDQGYQSYLIVGVKQTSSPFVLDLREHNSFFYTYLTKWIKKIRTKNFPGSWRLQLWLGILCNPQGAFQDRMGLENFSGKNLLRCLHHHKINPTHVHCHNLHGRYFNPFNLTQIKAKTFLFSMHDPWITTGHCCHFFSCSRWKVGCGHCPDLTLYPRIKRDATAINLRRKTALLKKLKPQIFSCSEWCTQIYRQSRHAQLQLDVRTQYLGVNRNIFSPGNKIEERIRRGLPKAPLIILFAASAFSTNPYKGYSYLEKALKLLTENPLIASKSIHVLCLGEPEKKMSYGTITVHWQPYEAKTETLVSYYRAADLFLYPSVIDTYPLAPMEALCCGTPVISTQVGGIPEIFSQQNPSQLLPDLHGNLPEGISKHPGGLTLAQPDEKLLYQALFLLLNEPLYLEQFCTYLQKLPPHLYNIVETFFAYNKYYV